MRSLTLCAGTLLALGSSGLASAAPAGYVTSVVAGLPDPNVKVPTVDGVPGAGVSNFSEATPQAVLTHRGRYVICITLQNGGQAAASEWLYKITQVINGTKTIVLKRVILRSGELAPNGNYAECAATPSIPTSPGAAVLTGEVGFDINGTISRVSLNVPIMLN